MQVDGQYLGPARNARAVLGQLSPVITKSFKAADQSAAAAGLAQEYMKQALQLTQKQIEGGDENTYKGYIEKALLLALQQMYALDQTSGNAKAESKGGNDFYKMVQLEKHVIKLQSKFRAHLTLKKMEEDVDLQKKKRELKIAKKSGSNEEAALTEFKQRLVKRCELTPEAFFRACDQNYEQCTTCEHFKLQLLRYKMKLSRGQTTRLILILDEDMNGTITFQEYQDALEAYGLSTEKRVSQDGSDDVLSFQSKALFKLVRLQKERKLSPEELFRSCDTNNDKEVVIKELQHVLSGMSSEFKVKDLHSIYNYFDVDQNNVCSEDEFKGQLEKAMAQYESYLQREGRSGKDAEPEDEQAGTAMDEYIPGYDQLSSKAKGEKLLEFLNEELKLRKINPIRIFSMADADRSEKVEFQACLGAFKKMIPDLSPELLNEIPRALNKSIDSKITKSEFEKAFGAAGVPLSEQLIDMRKKPKEVKPKDKTGVQPENIAMVKYLNEAIEAEGLSAQQLFKIADKNSRGFLTVDELKEQVKESLPKHSEGMNFLKLGKAFDVNKNGQIELDEFVNLLKEAAQSNADTSEFHRISQSLAAAPRPSLAPSPKKPEKQQQKKPIARQKTSIVSLVNQQHTLDSAAVIECLKELVDCDSRVHDPIEEIKAIFNKILAWKKKMGDQAEQAVQVRTKLKSKEKIKIHNVKTLRTQLNEFSREVGLSDDDTTIIIFTSLDHDYLTNLLCLSGEFLKWFTMNFAGENREEQDFLEHKRNIWRLTNDLAKEIIAAYDKQPDNEHESILTQEWWEHQRYSKIGNDIVQKLKNNSKAKKELRELFRSQQDKLSYYDLFQFLENKLKVNKLEEREEDALENRLDKLGMAFIEFNEFNEFSRAYGLEWDDQLIAGDLEEQLEKKLNLSYQDYELTEADLFQGCSTILRSEKAALAQVNAIYYDLVKKGKKFEDEDFGPRGANDEEGSKLSIYKTGEIPCPGYPKPETVKWISADQMNTAGKTPQFVDDGAGANDVKQGSLGDCWFIGALSVIVTRDELLRGGQQGLVIDPDVIIDRDMASALSKGVYPPIFHRFRMKGMYVLRFFKNFEWVYVIIDDRLPVNIESNLPVFGSCTNAHELWVALIEKAYAKLHGCYEQLISGYIDEGIFDLTAFQAEKILIRNEKTGDFPHKMIADHYGGEDGFWSFLVKRRTDNCLMGCSIKGGGKEGQHLGDDGPTGLIMNHAYGLCDVIQLDDPDDEKKKLRLLRIRNPWGNSEWNGAWGGGSEELKKYEKVLLDYIKSLPPDEQFGLEDDDGTFFMPYGEWKEIFSTLFLNVDFPDDWTGVRFKSAWTKQNSGGLPTKMTEPMLKRYAENPQFLVKPVKDCEMMFAMSQTGGRLPERNRYYSYPYKEVLNFANIAVFKLDKGGKGYLEKFSKKQSVYISPVKRERENAGRLDLKAGETYVIVPSCEKEGTEGEVYVSIYINCNLRDVQVKRVFQPGQEKTSKDAVLPQLIPEEAEKMSMRVPSWKLELVRESLQYMITDEDAGVSGAPLDAAAGPGQNLKIFKRPRPVYRV